MVAAGGAGGGSLTGNLLVLAASVSGAVYGILARRLLVSRSALFVTAYQNLFGALFMAPLALVEALVVGVRRPTAQAAGGVLFLTLVCSILAYLLLNYAFRFLPASRVSVFINLTPVVAVASAYVLLGERLTLAQGAAAVVVVAGVWVTNSGGRERERSGRAGAQKSIGRMRSRSSAVTIRSTSSSKLRRIIWSASRASACAPKYSSRLSCSTEARPSVTSRLVSQSGQRRSSVQADGPVRSQSTGYTSVPPQTGHLCASRSSRSGGGAAQ